MTFGKRILILVPHPDDEVVACAAAINRAQKQGADVYALYLTHGCLGRNVVWPWQRVNYEAIVARRGAEAAKVSGLLGIMPVGWRQRAARRLWPEMKDVIKEVRGAITANSIDQVWLPTYEGGNPDHDALNAIGQKIKAKVSVLEFAEYNFFGGKSCTNTFPYPNGSEQVIELTEAERAIKRAALGMFESEKANLNYVSTARECYRPLADYDYSQPPHPGRLWYARFQWVPFRHPRVDFTNPKDVSKAITDFLASTT